MSDLDSRLKDLQELHDKGLLTADELTQQRAEVLQSRGEDTLPESELGSAEAGQGTLAIPRIPTSGATRHEPDPSRSSATPIVIQPPAGGTRQVAAPAGPSASSPVFRILGLGVGLIFLGVCVYAFSDDIQSLLAEPEKKKKQEKKERAIPPADICEVEWEMERGEPYEPDREDYMGSMEMSDCLDRYESLQERVEEKHWFSFGECVKRTDSLNELSDCEFKLDQDRRESRKKGRKGRSR